MKKKFLSLLGAPGVVLHETGHLFFCLVSGVKIYRVRFFGFGKTAGFVEHGEPNTLVQSILISFGPLTFNSLVSLILFSQLSKPFITWQNGVFFWLGFVGALHSIPSSGDAATLASIAKRKLKRNPLAIFGFPFVGIIMVLNFFKRFNLHFLYAFVLLFINFQYLK
jgi:hypothetical protein